tara:strand:- start:14691 stop:15362 length:672 start_codon:yes stop_codon:yes gene_type:complete
MKQLDLLEIDNCNWYEFNSDPIAVALIRNEGDGTVTLKEIDNDPIVKKEINSRGYLKRADNIRKYYKRKLFMGTFYEGFRHSKFRKDLQKCLERKDILTVHHTEIGMIAKLPEFYIVDTVKDEIKELCNTTTPFEVSKRNTTLRVEYLRSTMARFGPNIQYSHWFRTQDKKAVSFIIKHDNPLVDIFEYHIKQNKWFNLIGNFFCCADDNFFYYQHQGKIGIE